MGLFDAIAEKIKKEENTIAVTVDSNQVFNLKSVLKYINQSGTNRTSDTADEEMFIPTQKVISDGNLSIRHTLMLYRALDISIMIFAYFMIMCKNVL